MYTLDGSVLTLVNYEYAYGNQLSGAADNPFEIDVLNQDPVGKLMAQRSSEEQPTEAAQAMAALIRSDKVQNFEKKEDPYSTSTYRTLVDRVGHYSYYESNHYTVYSSYLYSGDLEVIEFDAETGQKCTYQNFYHAWQQYGKDQYVCTEKINQYTMQSNTFRQIGIMFGLAFVAICSIAACLLHMAKKSAFPSNVPSLNKLAPETRKSLVGKNERSVNRSVNRSRGDHHAVPLDTEH